MRAVVFMPSTAEAKEVVVFCVRLRERRGSWCSGPTAEAKRVMVLIRREFRRSEATRTV
jgi:hypothetical protein